jgi:hypothetical protein
MPTRRTFLKSSLASAAALGLGGFALSGCATHEVPTSIANNGSQNVSAALTSWLANTGQPGDVFKLRRRSNGRPGRYWVPQGVRIGKPLFFDINGCELFTGLTLGFDDTNIEQSKIDFPALWNDSEEQTLPGAWPARRVVLLVSASNVVVGSSVEGARIQGAARTVHYRGGETVVGRRHPTGCAFHGQAFGDGQHGIRIGGSAGTYSNDPAHQYHDITIDLTNLSIEFNHGDGIYVNDNHRRITVRGRHVGEQHLGGVPGGDPQHLTGYGLQAKIVHPDGTEVDLNEPSTPENPRSADRWVPDTIAWPGIHHTGRQGVATDFRNYDTVMDGFSIWRTGRSAIDWEPAAVYSEILNPTMRNLEIGIHTLLMMPCAGGAGPIDNLVLENVICYELPSIDTHSPGAHADGRCHNWRIENVRCVSGVNARSPGVIFRLPRIDGLQILDNFALVEDAGIGIVTDTGSTGVNGPSTGVVIDPPEDVQFPVTTGG